MSAVNCVLGRSWYLSCLSECLEWIVLLVDLDSLVVVFCLPVRSGNIFGRCGHMFEWLK